MSVCPECDKPSIDGFTHFKCQKKYGLNGLLSIWHYEGVVRKAILALKYKYATEVGKELSNLIVNELQTKNFLLPSHYCFVPIPLHWYRENYRGFNQSILLGNSVANKLGSVFCTNLLIRKKNTLPQVGLKGKERTLNIKDVFDVDTKVYPILPSACILLDDVYTTGSTLKEAAKVLKRKGVERVWGLTIAR